MTTSTNLGITHLEENASSPEVRVNEAIDNLDESMNSAVTINFASDANLTLSTGGAYPNQWQYGTIVFTDTGPVLTAGRSVIVPTNERIYRVVNNTAQTLTVKTSAGTGIAVSASGVEHLQCDGTNVISVSPGGGSGISNVVDDTTPQLGGNLDVNGNSIVSVSNGNIAITPDGTGSVVLDGLSWPQSDGTVNQVLQTDGAGQLSFVTGGATDGNAIHDDTPNEITAITAKTTMDREDELLIEDSENAYNKKAVTHSTLMLLEENAQTGTTYTLVLDDENKMVTMSNASSNTLTVPPNSSVAFPVGAQVVISQEGAGQTTIAAGAGVTINNPSTLLLRAQYSKAALVKKATDEWDLIGDTE